MKPIKKQMQVWLNAGDEALFCSELDALGVCVLYLDDNVWDNEPTACSQLADCAASNVYLYPHTDLDGLPTLTRKDGRVEGPSTGVVIQYLRPIVKKSIVESGRFAVGCNSPSSEFAAFVKTVWKVLRKCGGKVDCINPSTKEVITPKVSDFLVGKHLASQCGEGMMLKYRSTENYYCPCD